MRSCCKRVSQEQTRFSSSLGTRPKALILSVADELRQLGCGGDARELLRFLREQFEDQLGRRDICSIMLLQGEIYGEQKRIEHAVRIL